jgi:hypothetical protein
MKLTGLALATMLALTVGATMMAGPTQAAPASSGALTPALDEQSLGSARMMPAQYYGYPYKYRRRYYRRSYGYAPQYYGGYGYPSYNYNYNYAPTYGYGYRYGY